jgi:prepilin-type N-terminal cleavage/methylation domain-containing protein
MDGASAVSAFSRLRLRAAREDGLTLIELLVTMVLLAIVMSIALSAFVASSKVYTATSDDSSGLADARKVAERMGRDIRNARGVDPGATTSQLVLWIDYNSDYIRQPDESITWLLQPSSVAGHYDVIRKVGTTSYIVESRSPVSQIAFTYDVPAPDTKVVTASVSYDAFVGVGSGARQLYFVDRLRNVDSAS